MSQKIIFRKFPTGEVIALFPEPTLTWIGSYMVVGQHSDAHPDLIHDLANASEAECIEIKRDLLSVGYSQEQFSND